MLRRKKSKADVVRDRATDLWGEASEMAGKAAETVGPRLEEARDDLAPKVSAAIDRTRDEVVPAVAEALGKTRLADTRLAETALVEPPKKKKHRIRKLLILAGIAGAAAYAYKKFTGDSGGTYSAPVPPPRPAATPEADTTPRHAAPATAGEASGSTAENGATDAMPDAPGDKLPGNTTKIDPVEGS